MTKDFHKKIGFNLIAQMLGRGVSILVAFVTLSLMARYLSEEGMGQYATIIKFIGMFGIIADFGLNVVTTRELSKNNADQEKVLGNAFGLRAALTVFVLLCAPLISLLFPYSSTIQVGILIAALPFSFLLLTGVLNSVLQKNLRTDKIAIADVFVKVMTFIGVYISIEYSLGIYAFILSLMGGNIIGFFLTWYYSSSFVSLKIQYDYIEWKKLFIHAYPIAITNFFILIYFNVDTIFLSVLKGDYDTGVYHVAYRVLETIGNFAYSFSMIFIPFFTKHLKDIKAFKSVFVMSVKYILFLSIPTTIVGIIAAPYIIQLLGGDGFQESVIVLQILFVAVFFVFLNAFMHNTLSSLHLQTKAIKIYLFGAVFNIVTNAIFIPKYSYYAAAVTTIISEAFIFAATSYLLLHWVRNQTLDIDSKTL